MSPAQNCHRCQLSSLGALVLLVQWPDSDCVYCCEHVHYRHDQAARDRKRSTFIEGEDCYYWTSDELFLSFQGFVRFQSWAISLLFRKMWIIVSGDNHLHDAADSWEWNYVFGLFWEFDGQGCEKVQRSDWKGQESRRGRGNKRETKLSSKIFIGSLLIFNTGKLGDFKWSIMNLHP